MTTEQPALVLVQSCREQKWWVVGPTQGQLASLGRAYQPMPFPRYPATIPLPARHGAIALSARSGCSVPSGLATVPLLLLGSGTASDY